MIDTDIISSISRSTKKDFTIEWENLCWILASECGWNQEDILNAEIPFVLGLINARNRMMKEQEKLSKRKK